MIRSNLTSIFLLVAALGIWGCAKSGPPDTREAGTSRALEAKIVKLEAELQTAQSARDHLRLKLESIEKERTVAARQLQAVTSEKNELRGQLLNRTSERDALLAQYDNFRKELRNLLGQADAAAPQLSPTQPVTAVTVAPTPGKS
jgi:chromosome segregation ATPase